MAAVETVVDLSRAPELTGTKSSQNGNLLQMLYGKELNCAKRVAIMVPDGAKSVSITLLEHLLTTCARNMSWEPSSRTCVTLHSILTGLSATTGANSSEEAGADVR